MQPKKIDSQAFCEGRDRKVRKRSGNFLENLKNGLVDATLSFRKKRAKNKAIRNAAKRTSYDRANIAKAKSVTYTQKKRSGGLAHSGAGIWMSDKWSAVKTKWNFFFNNRRGRLSWMTGKKAAAIMAVVVAFFVVTPIAVVSAAHGFQQAAVKEAVAANAAESQTTGTTDAASGTNVWGVEPEATVQLSSKSGTLMTSDGEILDENGNIITTTPGDATTASTPNETTGGEPTDNTLRQGVENERVTQVQERLMELGYMDNDEPTQLFGPATKNAVQLFQRKNSLDIDGCVGDETWNLLFSDQAQKYSVSEGITGTDVEQMQQRLVELGYLDHVTGYFGSDTTEAVKRFQERNNLTADGNIGENTRELLYSEDAAVNAITYGEEDEKIKTYQQRLVDLGYMTQATGLYGPETVQAVRRFQEKNGLISDGALGPTTLAALMSSDAQANALTLTTSGTDVEKVQNRLIALGYLNSAATGYYGSVTEEAVKNFQSRNGLSADGKVGAQTNAVLFSDDAKEAAKTSTDTKKEETPKKEETQKKEETSKKEETPKKEETKKEETPKKEETQKEEPKKEDTTVTADSKSVSALISVAKSKLGSRYVRGGKGPNTFDCSGFVYWCLNQIGVKQGYMTSAGWRSTSKYPTVNSMSKLEKGDIVCFVGHVGIYLGGGKMIDASSSEGKIRITSNIQNSSYWRSHFVKGCRVL